MCPAPFPEKSILLIDGGEGGCGHFTFRNVREKRLEEKMLDCCEMFWRTDRDEAGREGRR